MKSAYHVWIPHLPNAVSSAILSAVRASGLVIEKVNEKMISLQPTARASSWLMQEMGREGIRWHEMFAFGGFTRRKSITMTFMRLDWTTASGMQKSRWATKPTPHMIGITISTIFVHTKHHKNVKIIEKTTAMATPIQGRLSEIWARLTPQFPHCREMYPATSASFSFWYLQCALVQLTQLESRPLSLCSSSHAVWSMMGSDASPT